MLRGPPHPFLPSPSQVISLRLELEQGGRVGSATPAPGGVLSDEAAEGGQQGDDDGHAPPAVVSAPHRPPAPLQRGGSFTSPRGAGHPSTPSHARSGSHGDAGGSDASQTDGGSDDAAALSQRVAELTEALAAEQLRFERTRAAMEDDRVRWQVRGAFEAVVCKTACEVSSGAPMHPAAALLLLQEDMDSAVDACAAAEQRAAAAEAALAAAGIAAPASDAPTDGSETPHADHLRLVADRDAAIDEAVVARVRCLPLRLLPLCSPCFTPHASPTPQASLAEATAARDVLRAVAGRCAAAAARYQHQLAAEQRRCEELATVTRGYMQAAAQVRRRCRPAAAAAALARRPPSSSSPFSSLVYRPQRMRTTAMACRQRRMRRCPCACRLGRAAYPSSGTLHADPTPRPLPPSRRP